MLKSVFELKFLDVSMGRKDPIDFDIYLALFFVICFLVCKLCECFDGVMGGMLLTPKRPKFHNERENYFLLQVVFEIKIYAIKNKFCVVKYVTVWTS